MASSLAELQRFLNQQRAIGKPFSDRKSRAAFEAFFDAEAGRNDERSRLALQERGQDIAQSNADRQFQLQQEAIDAEKKSSAISGAVQLGTLASQFADTEFGESAVAGAKELGSKAISGVKGLFGGGGSGVAGSGAGGGAQAVTSSALTQGSVAPGIATNVGTGTTAATGGASAVAGEATSTVAGEAATEAASGLSTATNLLGSAATGYGVGGFAGDLYNRSSTAKDFVEFTTAIDPSMGALTGELGEGFARTTSGAVGGLLTGGPIGALFGGIGGALSGTWLCTMTKETVGFTEEEWGTIGAFREYSKEKHPNWLKWYVDIGPKLLEAINGDKEYYSKLKSSFLMPVIGLTEGGFAEVAYDVYKDIVIRLVKEHSPELMETSPEVN